VDVDRWDRRDDPDVVAAQIDQIAAALAREDPRFERHLRRVQRADAAAVVAVVGLLCIGAVGFTVGLAASAPVLAGVGAIAMSAACVVDRLQHRPTSRAGRDPRRP
jgi:hypothetical protein